MTDSTTWCFTINNYTEEDVKRLHNLESMVTYLIYGIEEAPNTGTKHLQGYVIFKSRKRLFTAKRAIGERSHIEKTRGSIEENYAYCSKGGNYKEIGRKPRTESVYGDLSKSLNQNRSIVALAREHTGLFIKHASNIIKTHEILQTSERDWKTR